MQPGDEKRTRSDLRAGDRVDEYLIQGSVAEGGFGAVYRAQRVSDGLDVALKVLHAELISSTSAVLRFEREIEVVRRIHHPNVVEIHGSGRLEDGRPYFVMELLSGVNLEAFVRVRRRLPPGEILSILDPLCDALAAVHEQGVIHRDLKASNIFLADIEGGARAVKLLDFGVAKLLDPAEPGLTSPSKVVGTPACMAPEQIKGEPATTQTDVYALGVLAYFMLTGELPFSDPSFLLIQTMHLHVTPERPSSVAPVSPVFDGVVLRALSKTPETRYATTLDFADAFRAAVDRRTRQGRSPPSRRGLAIHVDVSAGAEDLEDPDEALCADMEAVLPLAARVLTAHGFAVAVWTGNKVVMVANLPDDPERERSARREAVRAAMALLGELSRRATRDARVRVLVHVDVVTEGGSSDIDSSEPALTDAILASERGAECLIASSKALEGLGVEARPISDASSLYRVIETVIA